jgi:transcriptional regulator with XRE-family HTH domain
VTPAKTPKTEFGRNLRAELTRQDISVRALARRMQPGDSEAMRRNIARWLSPKDTAVNPSRASVRAVAEALGVPAEALMEEEDEEAAQMYAPLVHAVREIVRSELSRVVSA